MDAPQAVYSRLVELGRGLAEQQGELLLSCVELPTQIQALGGLEVQGEGQVVLGVPQPLGHEAQARRQVTQRRFMGGRGLGLLPGAQVESGEGDPLRFIGDQAAPEVQVMHDVEDLLFELGGVTVRQQEPPHREVDLTLRLVRNQRVRRLLHAVVEELVG